MRTLHLVRHGDTSSNAATPGPELERGWSDVGLADLGRQQMRGAAKELVDLKVDALLSSDLPRAKQSAKIVGDILGMTPQFVSQLRTWNLGEVTGELEPEADKLASRLVRSAPDRAPPGGESFDAFRRRFFAALSDALATHAGAMAIVTHSRNERLLEAWKAAGHPVSHRIDADVFLKRVDIPGGNIEKCSVAPDALKLSHREAEFTHGAKYDRDRCGTCKAYGGKNRCTKVMPPMDDDDWCAVGVAKSDGRWFSGPRKD